MKEKEYKKIIKEIEELKEEIEFKKESFIPRELEADYIKSIIELIKIKAIVIAIKEQESKEKI